MYSPTVTLNEEQIAAFHQDGYLVLPEITTTEEIGRLRKIYDHLFATKAGREEGNQYDLASADEDEVTAVLPQILNPAKYAPELQDILYRTNAAALAKQLLGPEAEQIGEHAILKPPEIGAETPWHQDEAYLNPDLEYNALSVWMPLQEATPENGCMVFLPGSHKGDVVPHHSINHDPRIHGLEVDEVDPSGGVACPLPAGGATIHHCRTLHYTGPNRSNLSRRAYILVFATPHKQRAEGRDFYWEKQKRTARDERRKKVGTYGVSFGKIP